MSRQTWRCFHCGDIYKSRAAAAEHFGAHQGMQPLCIDRPSYAELLTRLRRSENENWEHFRYRNKLEDECEALSSQLSAFKSLFPGCQTARDVFNKYDSMEGRALAAEEKLGLTVACNSDG